MEGRGRWVGRRGRCIIGREGRGPREERTHVDMPKVSEAVDDDPTCHYQAAVESAKRLARPGFMPPVQPADQMGACVAATHAPTAWW